MSIGETIEAVAQGDPNEEKISLGMKQTEQDPWMVLLLATRQRDQREGSQLISFGVFVEIEPGMMAHYLPLHTATARPTSVGSRKEGRHDAVILNIDRTTSASRSVSSRPRKMARIGETQPVGTGCVARSRLMDKGVVVDVGNDRGLRSGESSPMRAVSNPADIAYEGMNSI